MKLCDEGGKSEGDNSDCVCMQTYIECMCLFAVYQTYIGAMNENIRRQIAISNPFVFKHISNLKVGRNATPSCLPLIAVFHLIAMYPLFPLLKHIAFH